jgi:glutamine synthetase
MSERADVLEAETFLYKYPDIETIDLLIPDTNGILRGKRIKREALSKAYLEGIALPGSVFAAMITGDTVETTGLGFAEGDADRVCWPVADTLRLAPWQPRSMAQALLTMCEADGKPFFADPRNVLGHVLEIFAQLKLTPVVAMEMEFYLIDRERTPDGAPQPPISPLTGMREHQTQVYGISELDAYDALLDDMIKTAELQELPVEAAVAEYAPGQYEINLQHQPDPFAACDYVVMLKRLIRAVAAKHGFDVTFMAKPYDGWSGNGMHVHTSLLDENGNNVFQEHDGDPLTGKYLRYAVGGLAATMAEAMAVFAPNANSYRRFQPETYVPLSPVWGYNNRSLALRIPSGPEHARRIEHRVAGADVNPYLLLAVILAGIHHGITRQIEPDEPVSGNAYTQNQTSLPLTWLEALATWQTAQVIPGYLGEEFCRVYTAIKASEREAFNKHITSLEYTWYLNAT